jgi:DnaJ domain
MWMLNKGMLKRINDRPRKARLLPLAGAGAVTLGVALLALAPSPLIALAAVPVGALAVLVTHRVERERRITTLTYDELEGDLAARFSDIREALEALSSSEKIWRLSAEAGRVARVGDVAPTPERTPARVDLLETPGIRANIPIWGIDVGEARLLFFPEVVLLYRDDRYEGVPFKSVKVAFSFARFFEKDEVPEDAEVVERGRYESMERGVYHYRSKVRMPIVRYGLLEITIPRRLEVRLQVSNLAAAARFARTFNAEEAKKETIREKRTGRVAVARRVLGVSADASMSEITAAYKKMARKYHPDKVLELPAEARELSERRMKEITAAYNELKRFGRKPAQPR